MYPSRVIGYQDPLSWTFSKVLLAPICELVILYQPCSTGWDLHQAPHVSVIPWVSYELVQGFLSFSHMIFPVMWLHFQWLQMSLRSLCLLFVRSLVLQILLCIPRCFHLLHDGTELLFRSRYYAQTSFFLNWSSWLLLHSWNILHQWRHYIHHIILHLELSSLVL